MEKIGFEDFEREVVFMTLSKYPNVSAFLSWQFNVASVEKRVFSEHGFFTEYSVPPGAVRLTETGEMILTGPTLRLNDMRNRARFIIRVRNGALYLLEGGVVNAAWPRAITSYRL